MSEPEPNAQPSPNPFWERLLTVGFALYGLLALGYCAYRLFALHS